MATEDDRTKANAKGFAGLSSMVSDVGAAIESAANSPAADNSTPPLDVARDTSNKALGNTAAQSGDNSLALLFGGLTLVGIMVFCVWAATREMGSSTYSTATIPASTNSESSYSYSPDWPAAVPVPTPSPPVEQLWAGVDPSSVIRPDEVKPPTGRDNVLSVAQIRYCVAEEIRLDAADSVVNSYNSSAVRRFNALVDDYNSRCGSYRYEDGALVRAQSDMRPYESDIQAEGVGRFSAPQEAATMPTEDTGSVNAGSIERGSELLADTLIEAAAADRTNFEKCITGINPSLCDHSRLTAEQARQVDAAEVRVKQAKQLDASDRGVNLRVCLTGKYPSLCDHDLLTIDEIEMVRAAEIRAGPQ